MAQNTLFKDLLQALGLLSDSNAAGNADLDSLLNEWKPFLGTVGDPSTIHAQVEALRPNLEKVLDQPDRSAELLLVQQACQDRLLGLNLVLACLPGVLKNQAQRFWDQIFKEQDGNKGFLADWTVKDDLPRPGQNGTQYLIFSDGTGFNRPLPV